MSREEGLLIGGSGGTAVAAALRLAQEAEPDDLIVVLIPDSGRLYLSSVFDDPWMARFGFIRSEGSVVGEIIEAKEGEIPPLVYVGPEATVREAILTMRKHGVSQLPVAKGEMPLAAAEVSGAVTELRWMELTFADESLLSTPVEGMMGPKMATIGIGQSIELAVELLDSAQALLVLDGGRPRTVLSRTDVLTFLSPAGDDV